MKRLSDFLRENRACKTIAEQAFGAFLPEDKNILPIYYSVGDQYRVFAYYGKPAQANPKRGNPAVLLIHGGDGCAYYEWVKEWTEKGFVAIAPDFSAQYAVGEKERHEQNPLGGPAGYGSVNDFGSEMPWLYFGVLSAFPLSTYCVRMRPSIGNGCSYRAYPGADFYPWLTRRSIRGSARSR